MYIYYGMSAVGPHMSKYLFWKKHMTSIQMVRTIDSKFLLFLSTIHFLCRCNSWPYLSTHSSCCFENVIIHVDSCGGLDSMQSFSGSCLLIFTLILTLLDLGRKGKMVETRLSLLVHKRKLLSMVLIGNWMSCMKVQKQMVTQVLS